MLVVVPPTVIFTVSSGFFRPVRVNVNVPGSEAVSAAAASVAASVTTGNSLSTIVTVAAFGVPTV